MPHSRTRNEARLCLVTKGPVWLQKKGGGGRGLNSDSWNPSSRFVQSSLGKGPHAMLKVGGQGARPLWRTNECPQRKQTNPSEFILQRHQHLCVTHDTQRGREDKAGKGKDSDRGGEGRRERRGEEGEDRER